MTQFTLIAYRPNCLWSDSDLRIFYGTDKDEIISKITDLMIENHDDHNFDEFEFTIIIDGIPYTNEHYINWISDIEEDHELAYDENEARMYQIIDAAREAKTVTLQRQRDIKKQIEERKVARKERAAEKAREERDRKEYDRLRHKYEGVDIDG